MVVPARLLGTLCLALQLSRPRFATAPMNNRACELDLARYCPTSQQLRSGDCLACALRSPIPRSASCTDADIDAHCSRALPPVWSPSPPPAPGPAADEACLHALVADCSPARGPDWSEGDCFACGLGPRISATHTCKNADIQSYCKGAGRASPASPIPPVPTPAAVPPARPPPPVPPVLPATQQCQRNLASICPNHGVKMEACLSCGLGLHESGCR